MDKEIKSNSCKGWLAEAMAEFDKRLKTSECAEAEEERVLYRQHLERLVEERIAEQAAVNAELIKELAEHRQREIILRESEKLYRSVIENINDTFYRADTNGKLVMVSPSATKLLGHDSADDMIGWDIAQSLYYNPADREIFLRGMEEKRSFTDYELLLKHRNGNPVEVSTSSHYYYDEQGNILGIEGVLRDITERKQAQRTLLESEKKFRALTESTSAYIYLIQDNNFIYVNPAFETIIGYSLNELAAIPFLNFIHPDFRELVRERAARRLKGEKPPARYEIKIIAKNGQEKWIELSVTTFELNGKPTILGSSFDITERKQAEQQRQRLEERLRRAEKMEVLGTLAGGVAHDLNNMLGAMVGYPDLILMQLPPDSPLRKSILTIQKSGEKAAAVVQDLLTMARRGVTTMEPLSLYKVIRDYLKTPEHEKMCFFHPNIRLNIQLADDLLPVRGSAVHLSKTVMNLLSNAMEAMPGGGVITMAANNQYIDRPVQGYDDVKAGDYVALSVADTGQGIAQENIEKIFEPFYTKKVMGRSGTGLGLAIVWGTVKDHAGYIDVQSREGEGTTFTLFFPVSREKPTAVLSPVLQDNCMGKGESILVVDDVPEQREIAAAMLLSLNYQVTVAQSGEAAVEQVQTQKFDLLLLDMIMNPGMDGLETYRRICGIYPNQKAVIVSGFSETERVSEVQALGAGAYVKKPYTREKLGKAVRQELEAF